MPAIKKHFQKIFKSAGYFLFKILHGKVNRILNPEDSEEIQIDSVNKGENFSYKLYKIKKGILYTDRINDTAVIKNNMIVQGPSFQFRTINSQVVNGNVKDNIVFSKGTPRFKKKIKGRVLSLLTGGGGNENYWHWIFDVLPRLGICENMIKTESIDFFLLPNNTRNFQKESLKILGIPEKKQISSVSFRHIVTRDLYVTSHPTVLTGNASNDIQDMPRWISDWLKSKFIQNNKKNNKKFSKKIYLDRSDSKSNIKSLRSITNEDEVKNFLTKEGFQMLKLGELHFEDQVSAFNNAEVVVGLHGAGFANLSFCKSGTNVVELKPNSRDIVIKNLAIKNNLIYKSISSNSNKYLDQFGHINVSIEELSKTLKN